MNLSNHRYRSNEANKSARLSARSRLVEFWLPSPPRMDYTFCKKYSDDHLG